LGAATLNFIADGDDLIILMGDLLNLIGDLLLGLFERRLELCLLGFELLVALL